jgi:hypothetical protein
MARKRRNPVAHSTSATDLTPKEAALVRAILDAAAEGKTFPTRTQLGSMAGYGVGEVARTSACRALARPHVREAIQEGVRQIAGADVGAAYQTLRLAAAKAPSTRDRITAAGRMLDLAGMAGAAPQGPAVAIQIVFRNRELAESLARRVGQPDAVLIEDAG